jgi:hypothetical protein
MGEPRTHHKPPPSPSLWQHRCLPCSDTNHTQRLAYPCLVRGGALQTRPVEAVMRHCALFVMLLCARADESKPESGLVHHFWPTAKPVSAHTTTAPATTTPRPATHVSAPPRFPRTCVDVCVGLCWQHPHLPHVHATDTPPTPLCSFWHSQIVARFDCSDTGDFSPTGSLPMYLTSVERRATPPPRTCLASHVQSNQQHFCAHTLRTDRCAWVQRDAKGRANANYSHCRHKRL